MLNHFYQDAKGESGIHLTVFHGVAEDDANEVMQEVTAKYHPADAVLAKLSPVIGVHTGPGTVGMAYYFS